MIRMKKILMALLSIHVFLTPLSFGQDLNAILKKMQESATSNNYQGMLTTVFVNTPFTQVYRYKIVNYGNCLREEELLTDGANKEVNFDDGRYLWRFFPYKNLLIKEKSRMIREGNCEIEGELDLLKKNYEIRVVGDYDTNDRKGYKVLFKPKVTDRPRQVQWIDSETGIPLKIEKYGPSDTLVSVSSFSEIHFRVPVRRSSPFLMVPPETSLTEVKEESNLTIDKAKNVMGKQIMQPEYMPAGFLLRDIILRVSGEEKDLQLFYTDGLSSLSVFQSPFREEDRRSLAQMTRIDFKGAEAYLNVSGTLNILKIKSKPISTTLVSEVFKNELIKVGKSLTLLETASLPGKIKNHSHR